MDRSPFQDAVVRMNNEDSLTDNGAKTLQSSLSAAVDLFFLIGASRGKDITSVFAEALKASPEHATRILLWARDRELGSGERQTFRNILLWLEKNDMKTLIRVLPRVADLGRWDDLLVLEGEGRSPAFFLIKSALRSGNALCAKWMPREGTAKDHVAQALMRYLELSPKAYRKMLVGLTKVIETQMCAKDWSHIEYDHVPAKAASLYQKAFNRHDPEGYSAYREGLKTGERKINAGAVYPYDVLRAFMHGDKDVASAQWKALPNFLGDGRRKILPIVDVSGSMSTHKVAGIVTAMDVAVSLGLYIADRQKGPFGHLFMTFSNKPHFHYLPQKTLAERIDSICQADWEMNTDLEAAFTALLKMGVDRRIPEEEMPEMLLILSDMEFDECTARPEATAFKDLEQRYKDAGYHLPKVVFWNLNGRKGNIPVEFDQSGTALISGFSPAIMKSLLAGTNFTPEGIMLETIMVDRYSC